MTSGLGVMLLGVSGGAVASSLLNINFTQAPYPASGTMTDADFLAASGITHTGTTLPTFSTGLVLTANSDDAFNVAESKVVDAGRISLAVEGTATVARSNTPGPRLWFGTINDGGSVGLVNANFGTIFGTVAGDQQSAGTAAWAAGDYLQLFIGCGGGVALSTAWKVNNTGASNTATGAVQASQTAGNTYTLLKGNGTANFQMTVAKLRAYASGVVPSWV